MLKKIFGLGSAILLTIGLTACNGSEQSNGNNSSKDKEIASVGESVNYEIVGIDPGAGIMEKTEQVLQDYELTDWKLLTGSSAAMTAALKKAFDKEKPIIITGWSPHWKFEKFDLKYLEDPKQVYGDTENIHTISRTGLKDDHPNAYKILDQFFWTEEDMNSVMGMIEDGMKPEEAALQWIEENNDAVTSWTKDAEKVNGDKISLAYVAWDTEISSTHVIGKVLEDMGYDVTLSQVEAGPMWTAVADGSVDAHVAGWLPVTHKTYAEKFAGKFEDLGANLEGTKIGLVVPAYVEFDSIEDLLDK